MPSARLIAALIVLVAPAIVRADDDSTPVDYVTETKPIPSRRCYACHGALKQQNDLRLDTAGLAKKGGSGGPAIEPGSSGESLLILAVTGAEGVKKMPPEGEPLSDEQVA